MKPYRYVISLTLAERNSLQRLIRDRSTERGLTDRARIVLWADQGVTIAESALRLDCHRETIIAWRRRFLERRAEGIPAALLNALHQRRARPEEVPNE